MNPPIPHDGVLAELWRLYPHTFGQVVYRGWEPFRHLRYISKLITPSIIEGGGRWIINMPPQHSKTEFIGKVLPTWALDRNPATRVILASYAAELATKTGRDVRNVFETNSYLNTTLRSDSAAAGRWNTDAGGGMYTVGVGGSLSGFPGDLMLVDDPHKDWREAWSPVKRRAVIDWFNSTFYTRRQRHTTMIVMHTRWHPEDLTGYLMKHHHDDWNHIRLPAVAEEEDPLGRGDGEPLCPELHDLKSLSASRSSQAVWDSLYQQDPKGMGEHLAFHHFSDRNVDGSLELRRGVDLDVSFDFNIRPGMHAIIGQNFLGVGEDMLTAVHEIHDTGMDVRRCMDAFEQWWLQNNGAEKYGTINVFGDSSGHSRTITTSDSCYDLIILKLRRMGVDFRVIVPRQAPGELDSIDTYNEALRDIDGRIHYKLHPRCEKLHRDLVEVQTDEHGRIDKTNPDLTHAAEAERNRVARVRPLLRRPMESMGRVIA